MVAFIVHLVLDLLFVLNNISDRKTGSKKGSCTLQTTQRFNWELGPNCWRRWGGRMSASKVTIQDATLQKKSLFRGKARDWTASESVLRGRVFTRMFNNYFGHFFFQGQAIFYDDMVRLPPFWCRHHKVALTHKQMKLSHLRSISHVPCSCRSLDIYFNRDRLLI